MNDEQQPRRSRENLKRRVAERRAQMERERPISEEDMRNVMKEFAQLERDFAPARRSVNRFIDRPHRSKLSRFINKLTHR